MCLNTNMVSRLKNGTLAHKDHNFVFKRPLSIVSQTILKIVKALVGTFNKEKMQILQAL